MGGWLLRKMTAARRLLALACILSGCIFLEHAVAEPWQFPSLAAAIDLIGGKLSDRAAVLLFDGANPEVDAAWPVDYGRWERLTLSAWCAGARVLVFDVSFNHLNGVADDGAAGTRSHFVRTLGLIAGLPAPAASAAERQALYDSECEDDGQTAQTPAPVMPIFVAPVPGAYDLPVLRRLVVDYTWTRDGSYPAHGSQGRVNAALAAARAWCDHGGGDAAGCSRLSRAPPEMLLHDTVTTPLEQSDFSAPDLTVGGNDAPPPCIYRGDGGLRAEASWAVIPTVLRKLPLIHWSTCPPVPVVTTDQLDSPDSPADSVLKGRMVFVGAANISGINDTVNTEFHLNLPGVIVHALAADEYLGGEMLRPLPAGHWVALCLTPLLFIGLAMQRMAAHWRGKRHRGWRSLVAWVTGVAAAAAAVRWGDWPWLPIFGWAALVIVVLEGVCVDPADWVMGSVSKFRKRVSRQTHRKLDNQTLGAGAKGVAGHEQEKRA